MKSYLLFLFMVTTLSLQAQNNDYLLTLDGIGPLKLGMKQSEVEKILNQKFKLKNMLEKDGSYMDTTKARYKNTDITLYFEREYENENSFHMVLAGMMVSNPLFKTKQGITFGADKMKIVTVYENSRLSLGPDYEGEDFHLSKTLSSIYVYDDQSENSLVFHLKNKKVISIEVMRFYGD